MPQYPLLFLTLLLLACNTPLDITCTQACDTPTGSSKKVLIIGIDGCRTDALLKAKTPNIDKLIANGAYSYNVDRGPHTVSGPGWSNMLTGVWSEKHGVIDNSFDGSNYDRYPDIFSLIRQKSPCLTLGSVVNWAPLNETILTEQDFLINADDDREVGEVAVEYLRMCSPDVLFVDFDQVDGVGHEHGFHPNVWQYVRQIKRTDAFIGPILSEIERREANLGEDWLVLVTTDHGGTMDGHGGSDDIDEVRKIFLIVSGDAASPGEMSPNSVLVDLVPTALAHLGIEADAIWELDGKAVGLK